MIFSKEIANSISIILVDIMILFILVDTCLIYTIKHGKLPLQNQYYNLHRRHGFLKVTIYKLLAAGIISWALLTHQPSSGALSAPIIVYGMWVIKLLLDFIKFKKNSPTNQ